MAHRYHANVLAFSAFLAAVPAAYAQTPAPAATGRITGKITDKATGEGVYGALVIVAGTSKAVPADADGSYSLELAPGTYTLTINSVGFKPQKVENVVVKANQTTTISAALQDNNTSLGTVAVVGQKQTGTDVSLIKDLKKSEVVVSGVSSEQIVKTQDRDAAEVVKRIPGVTIQDSRFVIVRGLVERYNTVMLNDAIAPSSEADVRAFSFDALPSSAIDRILIFKSGAPELPGDFAGGVVKVYTRNSALQNATVVNVIGGFRAGTTGQSFWSSERSDTDFLGFDNGLRSMPGAFPKTLNGLTTQQRVEAARQLSTSWAPRRLTAAPDLRFSLGLTRVFDWGSAQITTLTTASYSNTYEQVSVQRNGYENFEAALGRSRQAFNYQDERGTQNTRLSVVHNWSARLNPRTKIEFRNLFSQIGTNQVTVRRGFNYAQEEEQGQAVGLRYDSRTIYSGQLQGTHDLADDRTTLTWTAGYSYTNRRQPDYRQYAYTRAVNTTDAFTLGIPNSADPRNGGRVFTDLQEHTPMVSGQWERRFGTDSTRLPEQQPKLRAGFYAEQKNRAFEARWPGFTKANFDQFDSSIQLLPIDQAFGLANINTTTGVALSESFNPANTYDVANTLTAGYVSGALPIGESLTLSGGARVEAYRLNLTSAIDAGPVRLARPPAERQRYVEFHAQVTGAGGGLAHGQPAGVSGVGAVRVLRFRAERRDSGQPAPAAGAHLQCRRSVRILPHAERTDLGRRLRQAILLAHRAPDCTVAVAGVQHPEHRPRLERRGGAGSPPDVRALVGQPGAATVWPDPERLADCLAGTTHAGAAEGAGQQPPPAGAVAVHRQYGHLLPER